MKRNKARYAAGFALTFALTAVGHAAEDANNAHVSGILIGTYQAASESEVNGRDVKNEANAQFYLLGDLAMGPGSWNLELRGGTTPQNNGVTSFYSEANDSVGETLDSDGHGRIAATQLFYRAPLGGGRISVGLLDASGFLDTNDIADNEYTQFMGSSFVNDPTVEYPSFAVGAHYSGDMTDRLGYQLFVGSSSGLEDTRNPTYRNVVDVGEHGKGVFTAGRSHGGSAAPAAMSASGTTAAITRRWTTPPTTARTTMAPTSPVAVRSAPDGGLPGRDWPTTVCRLQPTSWAPPTPRTSAAPRSAWAWPTSAYPITSRSPPTRSSRPKHICACALRTVSTSRRTCSTSTTAASIPDGIASSVRSAPASSSDRRALQTGRISSIITILVYRR